MATTSGRTVFVLGKEQHGNRSVKIVDTGVEYTLDPATIKTYTDDTAQFPYTL